MTQLNAGIRREKHPIMVRRTNVICLAVAFYYHHVLVPIRTVQGVTLDQNKARVMCRSSHQKTKSQNENHFQRDLH